MVLKPGQDLAGVAEAAVAGGADVIGAARERAVDVGEVNGRVFVNQLHCGSAFPSMRPGSRPRPASSAPVSALRGLRGTHGAAGNP